MGLSRGALERVTPSAVPNSDQLVGCPIEDANANHSRLRQFRNLEGLIRICTWN